MNSPGGYVYILYGDDTFGRDEAVQSLKNKVRALDAGDHNISEFGPETTVSELRMAADVVPFLADRRMVIVRGLLARLAGRGGKRKPTRARKAPNNNNNESELDEFEALLKYLPDLPQTTSLVIVEDGKLVPTPLVAAIPRSRAAVREYPPVQDVSRWVRQRATLIGVSLDEPAVRELASIGGADLRRLDSELRKLADYAAGSTVSRADVRELVSGRDLAVWALLDGLAERNSGKALGAFYNLRSQGEDLGALFGGAIVPHYHRLLVARELSLATREERARIDVTALGLNPKTVERWIQQAGKFDRLELERAMEVLLELDRKIKVGETEAEPSIEVAIVQLCTRLSPAAA